MPVLGQWESTQQGSLELGDDEGERLVFDLHFGVEGGDFWDEVEVILEEFCFEHGVEVFGGLLSFLSGSGGTWKQLLRLSAIYAISGT